VTATDSLVAAAVEATAAAIAAAGDELRAPFWEKDMQKVLAAQLDAAIAARGLDMSVKANHGLKLAEWPGVGPVDLSLLNGEGSPVAFLELKWGAGTLYNCVWDLPKMAVAVARQLAPRAYLVAGAPAADWEGAEGSELFGSAAWAASELLTRYAHLFEFFRKEVATHPLRLPTAMSTRDVATAAMNVHGGDWQLRCVEVAADHREWIPVHDPV
jgi:hypothetical protein